MGGMATTTATAVAGPGEMLASAGALLWAEPVRCNLVLTLLHQRVERPEAGRYWVVQRHGAVVGAALQSPLTFPAVVTSLDPAAAAALVDAVADRDIALSGVLGEAAAAANVAGAWTERTRSGASPELGQRIYEVDRVSAPPPTAGRARAATDGDTDLVTEWIRRFQLELGEPADHAADVAARPLAAGQVWLWDDDDPCSMAAVTDAVAGARRIGPVYTPADQRGRGRGSALVAHLSQRVRAEGQRCLLCTDLANPTSNAIYRALGYRAVAEVLRYRFHP
jgi:uncharacterized protein